MKNTIMFLIVDDRFTFFKSDQLDHKEFYVSLGYNPDDFENVVRGCILNNKAIFFKGSMYQYDESVIEMARKYAPYIRSQMGDDSISIYCGIVIKPGGSWEPVLQITDAELGYDNSQPSSREEIANQKIDSSFIETPKNTHGYFTNDSVIDFKNDYNDSKFIKTAIIFSVITLVLAVLIKMLLFKQNVKLHSNNSMDMLLCFLQVVLLIVTIYGYFAKKSFTKYTSIAASICIILTFDILDIILGSVYFVFSVDSALLNRVVDFVKELLKKIKRPKKG